MKCIIKTITIAIIIAGSNVFAQSKDSQDIDEPNNSCTLNCINGGYCRFMEGTIEELSHEAQSGHLIEECVCRPGFTGTTCELIVDECSLPERKCHNGAPCTQNSDGKWGCDCTYADDLSSFAGHQCRKPATEYCSGAYEPDKTLFFCTNGGRCKGDFLAAMVAPGDTSFNRAYDHRGCKCHEDFTGPHCEQLNLNLNDVIDEIFLEGDLESSTKSPVQTMNATSTGPSATVIFVLVVMGLSIVLTAMIVYIKLRKRRVPQEIAVNGSLGASWPSYPVKYGYSDSQVNGMHVSCKSVNLRAQTEEEEGYFA